VQRNVFNFSVTLMPSGLSFQTNGATPVRAAAQAAGITLPSSCRNGTCRTCLCRLISGEVRYGIEWPGISVDEKKQGWILACVAHACSDLTIEEPRALSEKR
jgi:ferredoxin